MNTASERPGDSWSAQVAPERTCAVFPKAEVAAEHACAAFYRVFTCFLEPGGYEPGPVPPKRSVGTNEAICVDRDR